MKKYEKFLIMIVLLINLAYIIIRFLSIPIFQGWPSFLLGLNLFIAEFLGFFAYVVYVYVFTGKQNINKKTLADLNGHIPTVDIFICTYNEDLTLLGKTIMAAKKLNYPKDKFSIYVLDDGNNNKLKELCNNFYNVNYISREKNIHAKAGNINNALTQTSGELFTVLDSDMICKPNYLQQTIRIFFKQKLSLCTNPSNLL